MAPIRYSLHYEDYSEHLMSRFGKLLQMQSLVDMTLMCSSHTLRVHKAVLAASSAYFQEVLQKQDGEPLIILKMRFSVLKCLVEFMYCGKTQCLEENLDELVSAAQFLKIKGLSKVTKEGLGIANDNELPIFTPPVVINRPPQSLIDLHAQENDPKLPPSQLAPATSTSQSDNLNRTNKDTVVRIPFDIDNSGGTPAIDYPDVPRAMKPRRGRPSVRRPGSWTENSGTLGRAAERALLRREQDSRKAIHHLKHLQTRHMQDYMDRVTISEAVNSICGPETSSNYINLDNDLNMYMDQTVSSNNLDSALAYTKEGNGIETINSTYSTTNTSSAETVNSEISTAMSQYVNALKSAGLPTDLPILFESGDGSYINVNEQVLLDMVQSSEIQYEVIEQPNIIEKVADPSEIKSIDDLSKSIERGEMLGNKNYASHEYGKDSTQYNSQDDGMNSLNAILPDNLESYADQQNYVVMDPHIQENNSLDPVNSSDFSCIDGDFFTKSMNDDVKKFYEIQHLNDARVIDQLCPTSNTLNANLTMSLLDTKISDLNENLNQQYNPLNIDDMRRNDDCYDFGLHLPQSNVFKEDLDCLIATPKRNEGNSYEDTCQLDERVIKERDEIIKDLMNIENKMNLAQNNETPPCDESNKNSDLNIQNFNLDAVFNEAEKSNSIQNTGKTSGNDASTSDHEDNKNTVKSEQQCVHEVLDLKEPINKNERDGIIYAEKENEEPEDSYENINNLENDVPYAVGLLPLKQVHAKGGVSLTKRKSSIDVNNLNNVDAKCLKRKVKYKNM